MSDAVDRLNAALEGRYKIESGLGEGGMATVYLADDLRHERKVALKVLKPELAAVVGAERFLAEIKTTANLQHPHILPLFDSGEADGFLFYVMPYVEGESLRDRLDREQQLPVDEAVQIATDLAEALDYAHRQDVIHRDIKPANILMREGRPVIADFGIALAVGAAGGGRLTETGLSLGTPFYMSPEQATGDQAVGVSTDTYALGSVLYEMLVGEPPYPGKTAQAVLGKIIAGEPVSVAKHRSSVPANVDAAVRKALEKLPADRFTSARELARALGDPHFRYGEMATVGPDVGVGRWKTLAMAMTALASALTLALGWAVLRPSGPASVTRVAVSIPEDQRFAAGGALELSNDGSFLVYEGVGEGGQIELWERAFDALAATPIPDTEAGRFPVLSPDGREVAFQVAASGSIRVVPLRGGVARTVTDSARCCVRWSPDGAWLYFNDPSNGLSRVPAAGGALEVVTRPDTAAGETQHIFVDVLPGGRALVFKVNGVNGPTIQALELESGEVKNLTAGQGPRYSTTGHLLFVSVEGTTLLAAPFDADDLELTGPPVPIADDLLNDPSGREFFTLSQTGRLLYRRGGSLQPALTPVWVERDGTAREIDPAWGTLGDPTFSSVSLSPDGTRLAVSTQGEEGVGYDLWVKQLDSGPLSRVTFEGSNYRAQWSVDGRSFLFNSDRNAPGATSDLWTKRADGSDAATLVLDREELVAEGFYSADGEWLVFREGDSRGGAGDIYALRVGSDAAPVPLVTTPFTEISPTLSPNGRWLAYVSNASGRYEVYVRPFPEAGSALFQVSTAGGVEPVWAHSGRELFYRNGADELVAAQVDIGGPTFTVGQQEVLFPLTGFLPGGGHPQYDVTPDDQRFVMLRVGDLAEGSELIWVENWAEEMPD